MTNSSIMMLGMLAIGCYIGFQLVKAWPSIRAMLKSHPERALMFLPFSVLGAAGIPGSGFNQTPTPQISIEIDFNELFGQINNWIEIFLPVVGIGIAVSVAIAILTWLGSMLIKAFRGAA